MRIFWQSFVDDRIAASYLKQLSIYLNKIAAPGTHVEVAGMSPPDRAFGRLAEYRCGIQAVQAGIEAEAAGFDAYVMGHFQDPGLYELRSALRIPAIGAGEATLLAASQLGRRLGLVTLDPAYEVWHYEQADHYGLINRVQHVVGMGCRPEDFDRCFAGDETAKARLLESFTACALPMVEAGADVIIPAGVLPGLLISGERGITVKHAPVISCAAVALKSAEMWVQLRAQTGIEPSRGPSFALANDRAKQDFMQLVSGGTSSLSSCASVSR